MFFLMVFHHIFTVFHQLSIPSVTFICFRMFTHQRIFCFLWKDFSKSNRHPKNRMKYYPKDMENSSATEKKNKENCENRLTVVIVRWGEEEGCEGFSSKKLKNVKSKDCNCWSYSRFFIHFAGKAKTNHSKLINCKGKSSEVVSRGSGIFHPPTTTTTWRLIF